MQLTITDIHIQAIAGKFVLHIAPHMVVAICYLAFIFNKAQRPFLTGSLYVTYIFSQ
jgi:hypothetical protein